MDGFADAGERVSGDEVVLNRKKFTAKARRSRRDAEIAEKCVGWTG